MQATSVELIKKLDQNLDEIIKVYRQLLNVVRREKEILIAADLDELNKNNRTKEVTLIRARQLEEARLGVVRDLAQSEGLEAEGLKLLDLARHFGGDVGERFRRMHSVLELLLKRVKEFNQHNEVLVNSALDNVTGAMHSIKETIGEKRNYKKGGQLQPTTTESGQLVRREA